MPRFYVDNKEYDVRFKHIFADVSWDLKRRITTCNIWSGSKLLAEGLAICNPVDGFSKKTGRKVAFTKALLSSNFDKKTRMELWENFFDEFGV